MIPDPGPHRPPRAPDPADQRAQRRRTNLFALAVVGIALLIPPPLNFGVVIAGAIGSAALRAYRRRALAQPEAGAAREPVVSLGRAGSREVVLHEDELAAHGLIVGASGSGKSTTLLRILTARIARGEPVVAIDLKGSPDFARELQQAAAAAGRPIRVWSLDGSAHWNPLQYGNATELKDKLIATERFTEPHYQRAAERYVQRALRVAMQAHPDRPPTLSEVVRLLEPAQLSAAARELSATEATDVQDYLSTLTRDQLSAIRGIGTRLAIVSESHTGPFLEAGSASSTIDLRAALQGDEIAVFSLNSGRYDKLAAQLGTLVVQDLISAAGARLEGVSRHTATIAIDEFSALRGDNVLQLLARGRASGVSVLLSTQELADLERAARGLTDQVLGNTNLKLAHRQDVPASARMVAALAGTYKDWEYTYRDGGSFRDRGGSRRVVDRFLVEPSTVSTLPTGALVRISKTPYAQVDIVQVTPPTPAANPAATGNRDTPIGVPFRGPRDASREPPRRDPPYRGRDGPER